MWWFLFYWLCATMMARRVYVREVYVRVYGGNLHSVGVLKPVCVDAWMWIAARLTVDGCIDHDALMMLYTGFLPYAGDGYAFLLPAKYNPTKERPFPNTDCYFEDNFDQVTNISVIVEKSAKSKIEDYGKPEAYLEQLGYLLGVQSYAGQTRSEGGFAANKVSTAAVLDVFTRETKGKTYYMYEILTRTADGDEGGRHQLIAATVSDGTLYIMKLQSGDKRWFKGQERDLKTSWNSFTVA